MTAVTGVPGNDTHGRKTRAVIITDSNHVILSAIQAETLSTRLMALGTPESGT